MATDGDGIAAKVWRGFSIAAGRLGTAYEHYRPVNVLAPISPTSRLGSLPAAFDPSPTLQFNAAPGRENETRATLVDGNRVRPGDYLAGRAGFFFVASCEPLLPIQSVICNATVDVARLVVPEGYGAIAYGHDTRALEGPFMRGWPASLTLRGTGGLGEGAIPGSPTDPTMQLLLPRLPGPLALDTGFTVTDDLGRRMVITAAERGPLGWRCVVRVVAGG